VSEWELPDRPVIGILHPGAMGAALGSALKSRAGAVIWAAADRSQATSKRAELADLVAVPDVAELARRAHVVISICPPGAAREVAQQVAAAVEGQARRPLFVDANAVSPATVSGMTELFPDDGLVDGAVIGPPAWERGTTVLWLSGPHAPLVEALFAGTPFEARHLGPEIGRASALKACFALQSKALSAIWLALDEAARALDVDEPLREELARTGVDYPERLAKASRVAKEKGWRWVAEMEEAADTLLAAGVPDGFSRAAAEMYRRA
jgi:3-hydroxyisobutyrate dehydrogenase-like beta-hydroxyacid dehydrogenase